MSRLKQLRDDWRYRKARARLSRVSITQVSLWADSGIWSAQQSLEQGDIQSAQTALIGVLAATDLLLDTKG